MLPIALDPQKVRVGLAGEGEALERRHSMLRRNGVDAVSVSPDESEFRGLRLLYIAGLEDGQAVALAARAQAAGVLVNVEDHPDFCDFHVPAIVRRGDLALMVSTSGRAPGLARRMREWLEQQFGGEWEGRLDELGEARSRWRAEGVEAAEISRRTCQIVDEKGWLS